MKDRAEALLKGISKEKKVAEVKLAKAQPALDAAETALLVCPRNIFRLASYYLLIYYTSTNILNY